jgi:hypothetical protein
LYWIRYAYRNYEFDFIQINNQMRINELLEKKIADPTQKQCSVRKLSNVRRAQCVSMGLRSRTSGHTAGTGKQGVKGSGIKLKGKKAKSVTKGGWVKDYSGK